MVEPIHLHPISSVVPSFFLASKRKDLLPLIVEIFIINLATQALQAYGKSIREEGTKARKVDRTTQIHRSQKLSSDLVATYCRIESVNLSGNPLPTSFHLGHRALLSSN